MREIIKLFIKGAKVFSSDDLQFGKDGYFFMRILNLIIFICAQHNESKVIFKEEVNLVTLKMFISRAFTNNKISEDLKARVELIPI